jgi:transcriptional regulator with XRE-family HTH domain
MNVPTIAPPELGRVIRDARKELGLTLDQVSERSGVSKSMLSQIERGLVNPTFGIVWNLTQALDLDMAALFGTREADKRQVVEHLHAYSTPENRSADGKVVMRLLSPRRTILPVEWYEIRFAPGGAMPSEAHAAGTYEHLTCLDGALEVDVGTRHIRLDEGDTIRYYADQPHAIRCDGGAGARAILLIALPSQYAAPRM